MQTDPATHEPCRVLRRPHEGRLVAGVAVGLAEYLGVDVAVVRIGLVALTLLGALGIPLYAAAWLFVPDECDEESIAERYVGHGPLGSTWDDAPWTSATAMASAPRRAGAPWTRSPGAGRTSPPDPPAGPDPEPRRPHDAAPS